MKSVEHKVNFLMKYAIFITLVTVALLFLSFKTNYNIKNFEQLNVKRINIIEDDGTIRMVISNRELQHSGRMNGKDWEYRERPAGLLFFNDEGDECGGLVFEVSEDENGKDSGMSFTMDRYLNDQVVQLINNDYVTEDNTQSFRGLVINDYPHGANAGTAYERYSTINKIEDEVEKQKQMEEFMKAEGGKNLMFVGKKTNDRQGIFINDKDGNPRIQIYVDSIGNPQIETITKNGITRDLLQ